MKNRHHNSLRPSAARRGVALMAAMIAVLLASVIGAGLLKTAMAQRRMAIREQARQQSLWLAESAIDRAASKLALEAGYTGETWNLPATDFGGHGKGRVVITVAEVQSAANLRKVTVTAEFPLEMPLRSRTSKSVTIDLDHFRKESPERKKP